MNPEVKRTAQTGVPCFRLRAARRAGSRLSRLMAIIVREAARMPALPVVKKAAIAATPSRTAPGRPQKTSAAWDSGAGRHSATELGSTPTVTKTTTT